MDIKMPSRYSSKAFKCRRLLSTGRFSVSDKRCRHSLSDINDLLRDTKAILSDIAQDQTTLRGSVSIAPSDTSDTELELEEKVADSKAYRRVVESTLKHKQISPEKEIVPQEDLINFDESPAILDAEIEEMISPAMEELRTLDVGFGGPCLQAPRWKSNPPSNATAPVEKRDSAQSTSGLTPSLQVSEMGDSSPRTPFSVESNGSNFFGRSLSSASGESARSAALESEFPEVVPTESLESNVDTPPPDPFPLLENPPSFVPLTTAQQLIILQRWQQDATQSGDASKQLDWAEDALHYTSIGSMYRDRISTLQSHPTEASWPEQMLETDAKQVVESYLQQGNAKALFLQAAYSGLGMAKSKEVYLLSLAKGYSRSAFYVGLMYEGNKATMPTALGYYNQGASASDSACLYVCTSVYLCAYPQAQR
jgi:hypothetical protein